MKKSRFIIRVYGILINEKKEILLSDEYQMHKKMTKFPGGGLEYGEGTIDCLKREAIEEFGQEIRIVRHLYTTDFYQDAMFHEGKQLLSIYYLIELKEKPKFKTSEIAFDFPAMVNGSQSFRWKFIKELTADDVTFPIDKKIVGIVKDL